MQALAHARQPYRDRYARLVVSSEDELIDVTAMCRAVGLQHLH